MSAAPASAAVGIESAPGELAFTARVGGREQPIRFRTETPVRPPPDPVLATMVLPAMSVGGELEIEGAASTRLLRNQPDFQAIHRFWSTQWGPGVQPLREIELNVGSRPAPGPRQPGRVATFFSGGVDSWAAVLDNPEVTDLVFARGLDLVPGWPQHEKLADEVEERLRQAAGELGLPLHVVDTNVRLLSDPLLRWESYVPSVQAAIALFFEPLFERVLVATDFDHAHQIPIGAARMIDHLWSTEGLEIADWGGRFDRTERLRRIVDHPVVQQTLRVCWLHPGGAYNCGSCGKCLHTMVALEAIGAREKIGTFPPELDLTPLKEYSLKSILQVAFWEELLETTRRADRPDLEAVIARVVETGHRAVPAPERELAQLLGSSSWRLTAPLRRLAALRRR